MVGECSNMFTFTTVTFRGRPKQRVNGILAESGQ